MHHQTSNRNNESGKKEKRNFLEHALAFDGFVQTVMMPDGVDGEDMIVKVKDGVLQITRPMAAALPKKIPLKRGTPTHGGGK
jgi:HSP20 family molecular chaperone IbpA